MKYKRKMCETKGGFFGLSMALESCARRKEGKEERKEGEGGIGQGLTSGLSPSFCLCLSHALSRGGAVKG